MARTNSPLGSHDAALSIAEAYECMLKSLIQLSRVQNDRASVKYLADHLETTENYHRLISKAVKGSGEWMTFCKMELYLLQQMNEECLSKIDELLGKQ